MNNLPVILVLSFIFLLFASCDDPKTCTQDDFLGTYTLIGDSNCLTNGSVSSPESLFFTAGSSEDIILENGDSTLKIMITDCVAKNYIVTYTLDGNNLTSNWDDCEWSYTKN